MWNLTKAPERNHYFYGMLMDVFHFERETEYFNARRYLLNRLVSGVGVICGLDVQPGPEINQIIITSGAAIDYWGREILVPRDTPPITLPEYAVENALQEQVPDYYLKQYKPRRPQEEVGCVRVLLCYDECETDPAPALAGDCNSADPCMPGTIREQYKIRFEANCDEPPERNCQIADFIDGGQISYPALVRWATERSCFDLAEDPCIPLANVMLIKDEGHKCNPDYIQTEIRPLCYTNDLLFELILGLIGERQRERANRK